MVSLARAIKLFDGLHYEFLDLRFEYDEERLITYGLIENRVYVCVSTELEDDVRRIISLRPAAKKEQDVYYQNF